MAFSEALRYVFGVTGILLLVAGIALLSLVPPSFWSSLLN